MEIFITAFASLKLAMRKGKPLLFLDYIKGFWKAKEKTKPCWLLLNKLNLLENIVGRR